MSLYAISDLHLANTVNQKALLELPDYGNDWLILAGDIGELEEHLTFALSVLKSKFSKIIWTPGNHDLWTFLQNGHRFNGVEKYNRLVSICRENDVVTPEDEYPLYNNQNRNYYLVPMLTLYDYSFKPNDVKRGKELDWALESGVICADEELLNPYPYRSVSDWCHARCLYTEKRLMALPDDVPLIVINHYPLLKEIGRIFTYPRFSIWCGTTLTEEWINRFNIQVVIYGHLHIRSSKIINGVRHEEVSLGYSRDWNQNADLLNYLRKIV
jgi:predicted phosphodiesterase